MTNELLIAQMDKLAEWLENREFEAKQFDASVIYFPVGKSELLRLAVARLKESEVLDGFILAEKIVALNGYISLHEIFRDDWEYIAEYAKNILSARPK